jgi:hypothetical protein
MSTLVLELPDKHIHVLERAAEERGISIDKLIVELVDTIAVHDEFDSTYDVTQDSLYTIQAHDSSAPADLAQNVDAYLYKALH